jgi:hypothetical protein
MKCILKYSRYGIDLDIPNNASKANITEAYLQQYGGPEAVLKHFLNHASFFGDDIKDATIIKDDNNITDSKENPN